MRAWGCNSSGLLDWIHWIQTPSWILDTQACVNVILGVETDSEVIGRAKEATEPEDECNVLDIQAIVSVILGV